MNFYNGALGVLTCGDDQSQPCAGRTTIRHRDESYWDAAGFEASSLVDSQHDLGWLTSCRVSHSAGMRLDDVSLLRADKSGSFGVGPSGQHKILSPELLQYNA